MATFASLSKLTVAEQLNVFLRAYRADEDVDQKTAFLFANYFYYKYPDTLELDINQAVDLVVKVSGEQHYPAELKTKLKAYDADSNGKMSLLEFLLMHFTKDVSKIFDDNDCDAGIRVALEKATAAVEANKEAAAKLEAEKVKQEEEGAAGGVKSFGANQRVDAIVLELSALAIDKGTGLKDLEKKLEKAKADRVAAGSDTQRSLEAEKLDKFDQHFQKELNVLFPKLEAALH
jgi:hypothetical protein